MKFIIKSLIIVALAFCAVSVKAQTTVTNYVTVTNSPTPPSNFWSGLQAVGKDVLNATNIAIVPGADVMTSGQKKGQFGFYLLALYDVNNYVGAGVGVDYMGGLNLFSGNVQLKLPIRPLSTFGFTNFVTTPYILAGLGTPSSGRGTANGGMVTIYNVGLDFTIYTLSGWNLGLAGGYGTRTGAGAYSGDDISGAFTVSRGF